MPNWCGNHTIIKTDNSQQQNALLASVKEAVERGELFDFLLPCPQELHDEKAHTWGGENASEYDALRERNKVIYGYENAYNWQVDNWGTKWDVHEAVVVFYEANQLEFAYETAWSPPDQIIDHLMTKFEEVVNYYFEPGMGFGGAYGTNISESTDCISDEENEIHQLIDKYFYIKLYYEEEEEEEEEK